MSTHYIKITTFYENGNKMCEQYVKIIKGDYSKIPEVTTSRIHIMYLYNNNNKIESPHSIFYDKKGNIILKEWFDSNKGEIYHRENNKPAIIEYQNGKPKYNEYWENGVKKSRIEI